MLKKQLSDHEVLGANRSLRGLQKEKRNWLSLAIANISPRKGKRQIVLCFALQVQSGTFGHVVIFARLSSSTHKSAPAVKPPRHLESCKFDQSRLTVETTRNLPSMAATTETAPLVPYAGEEWVASIKHLPTELLQTIFSNLSMSQLTRARYGVHFYYLI